jgi:signal peptidase I
MNWKPNKWIAAFLGLFLQPFGMLYVVRVKLAFLYFFLAIAISILEFYLFSSEVHLWTDYISLNWLLMIICAVHAYRIAVSYEIVEGKRPWYSHWYGLVSLPLGFFLGVLLIRAFLYEPFRMPSRSMYPTITPGSHMIVSKFGYGNYESFNISILKTPATKTINRGDLVVFKYPKDLSIDYIKRIVGLPGDKITYKDKTLYVNGKKASLKKLSEDQEYEVFEENILNSTYKIAHSRVSESINGKFNIPEGHYFVLGDNRDNSNDSRYWGYVPESDIIGKVVYIF